MTSQIRVMLNQQRELMIEQRNMYLAVAEELNSKYLDVMQANKNGDSFLKAVTYDVAGQLSTSYLGLNDLNITTDQIVRRTLEFSYENDFDPLKDEIARKDPLNAVSDNYFNEISQGEAYFMEHSNKEFGASVDRSTKGQQNARKKLGTDMDMLSGKKDDTVQADHVLARASIQTPDWLGNGAREAIRQNNEDLSNFQMINGAANRIKSDNQVWQNAKTGEIIGKGEQGASTIPGGYVDITAIASPEQLNKAFVSSQERTYKAAQEVMKDPNVTTEDFVKAATVVRELETGTIDPKTGKVVEKVSNNNLSNLKRQVNKNDRVIAKDFLFNKDTRRQNYKTAGSQAVFGRNVYDKNGNVVTKKNGKPKKKGGVTDLLTGQLVYYALPPLVYEVKQFFKEKKSGYAGIIKRLGRSAGRLTKYVFSKLKDIFKNVLSALSRNFVRAFMDLLIDALKGALKKVFNVLKDLLMSIVSSIKVLTNKEMSKAEKGAAITNLLTTTLIAVGVQALFDAIPEGTIPEWISMPVQIIVTAILSALALRILEENDLFNIQRGIKLAKLRQVFDDQEAEFNAKSDEIARKDSELTQAIVDELSVLKNQTKLLSGINYYSDDAWPVLEKINDTFNIGVDFDEEWRYFASV